MNFMKGYRLHQQVKAGNRKVVRLSMLGETQLPDKHGSGQESV